MNTFSLCSTVLAAALSTGALAADCKQMLEQMGPTAMQLSVAQFDEDEAKGWRALQNHGCFAQAAELIEYFALEYDSNYRRLKWHLAQMQAFAGNTTEAVAAARLSVSPVQEQMHPDFDWNDYVLASIAFLQKDRAAFDVHRSSLKGNASKSPLNAANVAAIERLALCFEKPYAVAYACNAP
jgi:hypothetical protein